jgi:chromosome segregation ATPase
MGEVRHVLQKATRDRDDKREELRQLQEELNSFTTMIDNQGGKCSETLRAMYDGFIRNCEDAKKKLENVEDTLKAMEEETQKNLRQYQDGQDKIASLEKDIAKEEEVVKWETRKKITIETLRCYVEMREKLMSASDELLRAERDAAVKKLESLS